MGDGEWRVTLLLRRDLTVRSVRLERRHEHSKHWIYRGVDDVWEDFAEWPGSVMQFIVESLEKQERLLEIP